MMCDYLGEVQAGAAIESIVIDLLRSGRLKGVGTGDHPTSEVGDLIASELRSATVRV
jgi:hypothetical protein